ncbi:hypothetical protein C8R45DRAFT_1139128 [Mycena sanguinolenta]|nr:hypothetical protein C8R45DRAFT_1139128 [Mycena sanguinolenta]
MPRKRNFWPGPSFVCISIAGFAFLLKFTYKRRSLPLSLPPSASANTRTSRSPALNREGLLSCIALHFFRPPTACSSMALHAESDKPGNAVLRTAFARRIRCAQLTLRSGDMANAESKYTFAYLSSHHRVHPCILFRTTSYSVAFSFPTHSITLNSTHAPNESAFTFSYCVMVFGRTADLAPRSCFGADNQSNMHELLASPAYEEPWAGPFFS